MAKAKKKTKKTESKTLDMASAYKRGLELVAQGFTKLEGKKTQITIGNARELAKKLVEDVLQCEEEGDLPLVVKVLLLAKAKRHSDGNCNCEEHQKK